MRFKRIVLALLVGAGVMVGAASSALARPPDLPAAPANFP